jgi:UDP-N-acetylglucosamine--N-acetylmuramyl-(pentapeptide) pyrophosphoryl-undecaprenol N-acetylglucosamine transferase
MGGSQGAAALNERLPRALGVLRGRVAFEVVHQAGRDRDAAVRETYASLGIHATVTPFIDDPARAIAEADLLVGRAGASTLAEIAAVGRPALLIPFPDAAGDHQLHNAQAVAAAGAGLCLSQDAATVERLAFEMERLLSDAPLRTSMATASAHTGRPHAAREIATDFLILAGIDRPATSVVDRYSTAHATGEA